jgi:hypothetical protein
MAFLRDRAANAMTSPLLRDTDPTLWAEALNYPYGIHVVYPAASSTPLLVVKLTQQYLLTARMNRGFKIYVVPVDTPEGSTIGLLTAFFEDADEPLTVWTPLSPDDDPTDNILSVLKTKRLTVRLFDEHDRELLGYEATIDLPLVPRVRLEHVKLLEFTHDLAHLMHEQGEHWFGARVAQDDQEAISINFVRPLYEENRRYKDDRPDLFKFNGAKGLADVRLEKDEPGQFQEIDIVLLLQRVFKPESIYRSPRRNYDNEEITDVIVITDKLCLLVEAKDSPNTERQLGNRLDRKRATTKKHLNKACNQLSGAIGYLDRTRPLIMRMPEGDVVIDLGKRNVLSLAVVRELFLPDYPEYSEQLYELHDDIGIPCAALDYGELVQYTTICNSEDAFVGAYFEVFNKALERKGFPRLRFGVRDLFDEDGDFRFE